MILFIPMQCENYYNNEEDNINCIEITRYLKNIILNNYVLFI